MESSLLAHPLFPQSSCPDGIINYINYINSKSLGVKD